MMRYITKTRSYLLNEMSAIELVGYNKVADNTFVNIVPMTAGKYVDPYTLSVLHSYCEMPIKIISRWYLKPRFSKVKYSYIWMVFNI
jgi:hypothetical protein